MADTIIIAHRDLDGVAGAALYTYCKGYSLGRYKVVYAEPNALLKLLRRYHRGGRRYVVIDIGLNNDVYDELVDMDLSSVTIEWYDHHLWEKAWIDNLVLKGMLLTIDTATCATGVVAKSVCEGSNHRIRELVEMVCGADLWKFDRYESPFLFRYADLENSNSWRTKVFETLIAYLNGVITDIVSQIERDVLDYVDAELRVLSTIESEVSVVDINGVKFCIYMKKQHIPSASIIGNVMLSKCDVVAIVSDTLRNISFRSRKCNVREVAKAFGGGGHAKASGAPLHVLPVYRVLKGLAPDLVKKYIVGLVIEKIKDIDMGSLCTDDGRLAGPGLHNFAVACNVPYNHALELLTKPS